MNRSGKMKNKSHKTKQMINFFKKNRNNQNQHQKSRQKEKNHDTNSKKTLQTKAPQEHQGATQGQWGSASAQLLEAAPKQIPLIPVVTVARSSSLMKKIIHFPLLQHSFLQLSSPSVLLNMRLGFVWFLFSPLCEAIVSVGYWFIKNSFSMTGIKP